MSHRRDHFDEWGGCQCWCVDCAAEWKRWGARKPCICPDCKCGGGAA